ncbi:hypothetical protein, partial [Oceanihabitans sediminis]|uniref:hypothetical protein n=1 Tax=Oceanihabitans sediminis TaxID=1812012 RepID=UPI00299EED05
LEAIKTSNNHLSTYNTQQTTKLLTTILLTIKRITTKQLPTFHLSLITYHFSLLSFHLKNH